MKYRAFLAIVILIILPVFANAREGGDWSNVDPDTRAWIKSLHRPDLGDGHTYSCCGEGDAYEADTGVVGEDGQNYAIITNSRGNPLPVGTKLLIPPNKVQNQEGNPIGHVIIFASEGGSVFCFIPNGGF